MTTRTCRPEVRATRPKVVAIVRREGHARKITRDDRVRAAEAVAEFLTKVGSVGISHDDRGHHGRLSEVIVGERCQETIPRGEGLSAYLLANLADERPVTRYPLTMSLLRAGDWPDLKQRQRAGQDRPRHNAFQFPILSKVLAITVDIGLTPGVADLPNVIVSSCRGVQR
jgi:hypothetical protein